MVKPQENRNGPRLTVILSTLGNYATLKRVLDGFSQQTAPSGTFEMVVVMDAADAEPEAVEQAIGTRPYPVRRITGSMPGLSANRNAGLKAAQGSLVLFTDNDTIPVRRLVSEHLTWHERYPAEEIGVLGRMRWAREAEVTTFMRWLDTGIHFDFANIKGIDAGWGRFAGGNISLKRSFIERVGDFDNEHFPYLYEDTEWAYRASKVGFRLLYNRRAIVDHLRPTTIELWKKRARRVAVAEYWFMRLHPELSPWFHTMFEAASSTQPARGRAMRLAPYVPRWVPWLGPRVWKSVDTVFKQTLAPYFLTAWEEAVKSGVRSAPPDLSEFAPD